MNIAKIIQQKPIKCTLWSPLIGECFLDRILPNNRINVKFLDCDGHYKEVSFSEDGRYFDAGECVLFPSKEMRDWDKYAWKEGDTLTNGKLLPRTFIRFIDNTNYTCFETLDGERHKTCDFYKYNNPQFKPYDKVLVRDSDDRKWIPNLFSYYSDNNNYPYFCIGGIYKQCIPFDENLVGTTKNPNYEKD